MDTGVILFSVRDKGVYRRNRKIGKPSLSNSPTEILTS